MLQDHGDKVLHCARFFRGSKDDFLLLLEDDVALASDFWARASAANLKWLDGWRAQWHSGTALWTAALFAPAATATGSGSGPTWQLASERRDGRSTGAHGPGTGYGYQSYSRTFPYRRSTDGLYYTTGVVDYNGILCLCAPLTSALHLHWSSTTSHCL